MTAGRAVAREIVPVTVNRMTVAVPGGVALAARIAARSEPGPESLSVRTVADRAAGAAAAAAGLPVTVAHGSAAQAPLPSRTASPRAIGRPVRGPPGAGRGCLRSASMTEPAFLILAGQRILAG
jgi:hypothetical protein